MPPRTAQLSLTLPTPPGWGGRRANAGRKRSEGSGLPHTSRDRFSSPLPAHVTIRLLPELLSLRTVPLVREIEQTFAQGCDRSTFRLVHYSLQGNHAHLIVEARDREALACGMKAIGSRLARAVNRVMERSGRVFADRYHLHLLKTPREVHRALRYVLLNARRHARKARVILARHAIRLDPASSARWFDGWKTGTLAATSRSLRAPVARARTWLLTVGWRRHGLLDPADVPG